MGDPSGRAEERIPADQAKTEHNTTKLRQNVATFFESGRRYAQARLTPSSKIVHKPKIINNKEWLQQLGLLEFLQTAGIHIKLNTMLARERYIDLCQSLKRTINKLCTVYDRGWSRKRAYLLPNLRTSFYKDTISSGYTKTWIARYKWADLINGEIS